MVLPIEWSLVVSAISLGFAPLTVWLAREQLRHAKQLDGAQQISLRFERVGIAFSDPQRDIRRDKVAIGLSYSGFNPLRGIAVHVLCGSQQISVEGPHLLAPGEERGPIYLELPHNDLEKAHLHVAWQSPHPSQSRGGLRYQAVRMNLNQEVQQWRWHRCEAVRRACKKPLGKWKKIRKLHSSQKNFPGWPDGNTTRHAKWT